MLLTLSVVNQNSKCFIVSYSEGVFGQIVGIPDNEIGLFNDKSGIFLKKKHEEKQSNYNSSWMTYILFLNKIKKMWNGCQ